MKESKRNELIKYYGCADNPTVIKLIDLSFEIEKKLALENDDDKKYVSYLHAYIAISKAIAFLSGKSETKDVVANPLDEFIKGQWDT